MEKHLNSFGLLDLIDDSEVYGGLHCANAT